MKKNIARLQRWLDRLSGACEVGKWDSALIEADCLSAEVRKTRDEIMDSACRVCEEKSVSRGWHRLFMTLRTVSVAFVIVLAVSLPSALEADRPWQPAVKTVYVMEDRLSWVTPEEESLLLELRSEMSKGDLIMAGNAAKLQVKVGNGAISKNVQGATNETGKDVSSGSSETAKRENKAASGVTNEDLATLVQIGEKALRGSSPAIKVVN